MKGHGPYPSIYPEQSKYGKLLKGCQTVLYKLQFIELSNVHLSDKDEELLIQCDKDLNDR